MNGTNESNANADVADRLDGVVMPSCYPEHNTDSEECWCEPTIEIVNGTKIITHREVH